MKEIQLSRGKVALVDDEDFELLNQYKWYAQKGHKTFYATTSRGILMHRLILGLNETNTYCDHEDYNGLNNQKSNLRIATNSQNSINSRKRENTTSKYKGVWLTKSKYKDKAYLYWQARVNKDKKVFHLGYFKDEQEAALAYNKKAFELFGEFANLNKF